MLDALTWQHQVLLAETIISASIGVAMILRGPIKPNIDRSFFFLLWNAVLFWLLFSGARHDAWQYWAVTFYYLLDTFSVVKGIVRPRTLDSRHTVNKKTGEVIDTTGFAVTFAGVWALSLLTLIVTGA